MRGSSTERRIFGKQITFGEILFFLIRRMTIFIDAETQKNIVRCRSADLTEKYIRRKKPTNILRVSSGGLGDKTPRKREGEIQMISKIVRGAVLTGVLVAFSAPIVANAADADAPKTKAECKKAKDMKWDKTTKSCVKK